MTRDPGLKSRVLAWLSALLRHMEDGNPIGYVSDELARARENICQACPYNTLIVGTGCSSCRKAVNELRTATLRGRPEYDRLHGCQVLGIDNRVSVHLDSPPVENAALPDFCWMRKS